MNDNGEIIKHEILATLKNHPEGLTIQNLSEILGIHRQTVTKYVLVLEALNLVHRRRIGPATLQYLRENFVHKAVEEVLEKAKKEREKPNERGGNR